MKKEKGKLNFKGMDGKDEEARHSPQEIRLANEFLKKFHPSLHQQFSRSSWATEEIMVSGVLKALDSYSALKSIKDEGSGKRLHFRGMDESKEDAKVAREIINREIGQARDEFIKSSGPVEGGNDDVLGRHPDDVP